MVIGIDARFYGPRQKGLGRYVQKLLEELEHIDSDNQYVVFLRRENWSAYQPARSNFQKVLADYRWYSLAEQLFMPWAIRRAGVELMYFPHFNVPLLCRKPYVMTIHDLILKRFPTRRASTLHPFMYWIKNSAYNLVIWRAVRQARKIIAVSSHTKQDILQYFNINPAKLEVVYEGAPSPPPQINAGEEVLRKYGLTAPYLLYVGNAYPHKNLARLIFAFDQYLRPAMPELQLALVGELDYFYRRLRRQFAGRPQIIFTDFVSDDELAALYSRAAAYVFPSLCEGFGLPPLEAMAHRLPVAASRSSCLPEILGEAALFFDPEDAQDMAAQIKHILCDEQTRHHLIGQGSALLGRYSWQRMAQKMLKIFMNT